MGIASCPTVVLASWIHSITECKTFDSVCCDPSENSNIVTVFSTYINIICTQQTGASLSLAILAPPSPIINHPIFLPLPLSTPLPPPCPHPLGKVIQGWEGWGPILVWRTKRSWTLPAGVSEPKPDRFIIEWARDLGSGGLVFQTTLRRLPCDS